MQFGIALDLGPAALPLGEHLRQIRPVLKKAEKYGLDSVWVGENYAQGPGAATAFHGPSALMVLAALSGETSLGLGSGVVLLRAYDTLRLAYDVALLDSLSEGRLTVGIGLGPGFLASRFGQPAGPGEVFDERLEALLTLLRGGDGYEGKHVSVQGGIFPLAHRGRVPPLLIGGGVRASLERAVRFGQGWYASSAYSFERIRRLAGEYRAELARREGGPARVAVNRLTVLKRDGECAREAGARYAGGIVAAYAAVGSLDDRGTPIPPGETDVAAALGQRSIIGDAETAVRSVQEYARVGVTDVQFRIAPVGMPVEDTLETLDVLGDVVIPRLRAAANANPGS
ncbi:LLM class flavin-dependent oxidoreductase [Nonomuraea sp. NPDC049486]|uniref:LLM class flavin-dependent oxidoreductase n=1 Tax=Nonomuraea sp. NPDC049486 TaxID=3155773 RepID=UPI00342C2EB9